MFALTMEIIVPSCVHVVDSARKVSGPVRLTAMRLSIGAKAS